MVQMSLLTMGTSSPKRWLPQAAAAARPLQAGAPCDRTEEEHLGAPELGAHVAKEGLGRWKYRKKKNSKSNILNAYLEI